MGDFIDVPDEALDRRRGSTSSPPSQSPAGAGDQSPLPPPPHLPPPPPLPRKRDQSSPPLPPPPPVPPPQSARGAGGAGERDREYRRRRSSSRSPPPPGPYKRHRREDGGYDRRRGSPRGGGYGADDRRYGNDYGGPGGRGGYGEERNHGRYMNRTSDWLDSGRGDGTGTIQREGLMSYKQFIQELEDDVLPVEAQRRYEEYRSEYITTQKRAYFNLHKEEDWLKNKYHPTNLETVIERRNELARTTAKEFFLDLQSGTLDLGPGLTSIAACKSGNGGDVSSEDEADLNGKRRRYGKGTVEEKDLFSAVPKAHSVSSEPRRIQVDIGQAQALICKLDLEKGIEDNVLSSSDHDKSDGEKSRVGSVGPIVIIRGLSTVKGLEGVELLDTLITFLWRVHGVDYYGLSETNEAKGLRHVRADTKSSNRSSLSAVEWEKKLDSFWHKRLKGQDPLEILKSKDKIDAAAGEVLDPYVRKIRDEKYGWKYGCGAKGCTKLFHAPEFVHKHLRLKHADLVVELTSKVREDIYFENYMNDPNAPGGTPIMQQSAPNERPRHRPSIDSRLRDDRGRRRDYDRVDRGDGRYYRNRDSAAGDVSSGPDHGNPDDPVYDSYGDLAMHGTSFPPDVPAPPVLMPVPGAGPLGPFVPAPPEVAMRMLRDQGGPPPFDANNGPRPRKGRAGPPMSSAAPLLAVPPLVHDPRRIRSYQDLDAPEDEITVMDYRSL